MSFKGNLCRKKGNSEIVSLHVAMGHKGCPELADSENEEYSVEAYGKVRLRQQPLWNKQTNKRHKTKKTAEFYSSNKHGCSHVSFTVENLDDIAGKITELGGSIVNLPCITDDGVFKVMYCHDLDGIIIELVEELK